MRSIGLAVDAVAVLAHQRFAAQLEQDALVGGRAARSDPRASGSGRFTGRAVLSDSCRLAHLRHHFGHEIGFLLLDALTDHVQREPGDGGALRLEQLRRRSACRSSRTAARAASLPSGISAPRPRPSSRRCSRACPTPPPSPRRCCAPSRRSSAGTSSGDSATGLARRDVHRDVLGERLVAADHVDQHADLRAAVHVGREPALRRDAREAPDRHVLADLARPARLRTLFDRRAVRARAADSASTSPDCASPRARRRLRANARNSSFFATKSVSQLTSTSAPVLPSADDMRRHHAFRRHARRRLARPVAELDPQDLLGLRQVAARFGRAPSCTPSSAHRSSRAAPGPCLR